MTMYLPLSAFFGLSVVLVAFVVFAFRTRGIMGVVVSIFPAFIALYLSQVAVNGQLVQNIGGVVPSTGATVQGVTVVQMPGLSYIFLFIAVIMGGLLIFNVGMVIKDRDNSVSELDF